MRGLHGDAGGGGEANGGGQVDLADAAVAAARRYRVGGPLIDGLMAELGMTGGSLNGMLSGGGAEGAITASPRHVAGANGSTAPSDAAE